MFKYEQNSHLKLRNRLICLGNEKISKTHCNKKQVRVRNKMYNPILHSAPLSNDTGLASASPLTLKLPS